MAIWRIALTWGKDELAAQQLKASTLPEPTAVGEVSCHFSPMHRLLCLLEQSTRCLGDHARIRLLSTLLIMEDGSSLCCHTWEILAVKSWQPAVRGQVVLEVVLARSS